uniref:CSON001069 protein n=1 Tax=Culicoides sonorensis TaxID=179676 RepID=A0A336LUG6_CULSO
MNTAFKLSTGYSIPLIGLGTYQIRGAEIFPAIDFALQAGYRHIDTASGYRNEKEIGDALKSLLPKYNLNREQIFITSKLVPRVNQTKQQVVEIVKQSLSDLQTNYIDLYLIHWPGVSGIPVESAENSKYRRNTFEALSSCQKEGLCRSIGVSNYTVKHLKELLEQCTDGIRPTVNQVEWHPHFHQPELLEFCRKENIFLQAYSSLGTSNTTELKDDPQIKAIAQKLNKSPSQILLRWAFQQNIGILPKARSKSHIDENIDLNFTIPDSDMDLLNNMKVSYKYAWNPESVL